MGLSEKKGWEWGRHGATTRAEFGSGDGERESRVREREKALDSLRNLEVPSGVGGGAKDRARQPLTQIPLLANIPVVQIYGLPRNNNCQTPEDKTEAAPPHPQVNRA